MDDAAVLAPHVGGVAADGEAAAVRFLGQNLGGHAGGKVRVGQQIERRGAEQFSRLIAKQAGVGRVFQQDGAGEVQFPDPVGNVLDQGPQARLADFSLLLGPHDLGDVLGDGEQVRFAVTVEQAGRHVAMEHFSRLAAEAA